MKTLLRLDASARAAASHSRSLGNSFEAAWRNAHPKGAVIVRDLAGEPIPHISNRTIEAMFSQEDLCADHYVAATALSDRLIAEIERADEILVTVPMYNFGIPSSLKAWIDHISRIGKTFSFDGQTFKGLLGGKPVYVVCSYGASGYQQGGGFAGANFVEPYMRFIFEFLALTPTFLSNSSST